MTVSDDLSMHIPAQAVRLSVLSHSICALGVGRSLTLHNSQVLWNSKVHLRYAENLVKGIRQQRSPVTRTEGGEIVAVNIGR
jgi:hypothetical protein